MRFRAWTALKPIAATSEASASTPISGSVKLVEAELHGVAVVGDRLDLLDARPGATGS